MGPARSFPKIDSELGFLVVAVITSLVTLGTLIGLLIRFDEQLIFDNRSVTLNAIVATLSTGNRAGITYAIGFALGQWKWISFSREQPRRLQDFERLDLASRGPLGGIILLVNNNVKGLCASIYQNPDSARVNC